MSCVFICLDKWTNLSKFRNVRCIFSSMENSGVGENLMVSSCDSLASMYSLCKHDDTEEYAILVDVSKGAVIRRVLKWSGLKPVSFFLCTQDWNGYYFISMCRFRLSTLFLEIFCCVG